MLGSLEHRTSFTVPEQNCRVECVVVMSACRTASTISIDVQCTCISTSGQLSGSALTQLSGLRNIIKRLFASQQMDGRGACIGYRHVSVSQTLQVMADRRNKIALPALATKYGFRLPPPEDCLIAPIFQFHPRNAPENMEWEDDPIPAGNAHTGNICIFKGNSIQSSACQLGLSATVITSSCCGMFK